MVEGEHLQRRLTGQITVHAVVVLSVEFGQDSHELHFTAIVDTLHVGSERFIQRFYETLRLFFGNQVDFVLFTVRGEPFLKFSARICFDAEDSIIGVFLIGTRAYLESPERLFCSLILGQYVEAESTKHVHKTVDRPFMAVIKCSVTLDHTGTVDRDERLAFSGLMALRLKLAPLLAFVPLSHVLVRDPQVAAVQIAHRLDDRAIVLHGTVEDALAIGLVVNDEAVEQIYL